MATKASGEGRNRGLPPLPGKGAPQISGSRPAGKRFRATLTKEQAALIYTLRPPDKDDPAPNKLAGNSQLLSKRFGVSPKAVRDVWNRRTWAHATKDQRKSTPVDMQLLERSVDSIDSDNTTSTCILPHREHGSCNRFGISTRSPGRPVGSKDSKPRRRRSSSMKGSSDCNDSRSQGSRCGPLLFYFEYCACLHVLHGCQFRPARILIAACVWDLLCRSCFSIATNYSLSLCLSVSLSLSPPHSSKNQTNSDYGWTSQSESPPISHEDDCGDAMDYLFPSMSMGEGSSGSTSSRTCQENDSNEDLSDDRSFPFFLSASILRQQNEFSIPERSCYPSQGMGPMGQILSQMGHVMSQGMGRAVSGGLPWHGTQQSSMSNMPNYHMMMGGGMIVGGHGVVEAGWGGKESNMMANSRHGRENASVFTYA